MMPQLIVLLMLAAPPGRVPDGLAVGIEMRNVHLHVAPDTALDVYWLRGRLRSTRAGAPPVFDDQQSFVLDIEDGEIGIDAASLTAIVNRAFQYKGSSLSNLQIGFDHGLLVQRGTLKKGFRVPFSVTAAVSVTPDGRLDVHPVKVKAAGIPAAKLMALFGVELDDLIKARADRGIELRDNDLLLSAARMLPPPVITGTPKQAFVRGDRLVQVFGRGTAARPRLGGNYIWFRGGSIRFGKLLMSDTDLKLIDMDSRDPFDFYAAKYNAQLVAGYSKNTPDHGLRTYMPDYEKTKSPRAIVASGRRGYPVRD